MEVSFHSSVKNIQRDQAAQAINTIISKILKEQVYEQDKVSE